LYTSVDAVDPIYTELLVGVDVAGGVFSGQLGVNNELDPAIFATEPVLFLGVSAQGEPELPRVRLRHAPYAVHASSASSLQCTGCVGADHLNPDFLSSFVSALDLHAVAKSGAYADLEGTPDLSGFAKSADLHAVATTGKYSDLTGGPDLSPFAKSADLAAVATSGKYSDLSGGPDMSGTAKLGTSNVFEGQNKFNKEVGIGAAPALGCPLNVSSFCIDGKPAALILTVASVSDLPEGAAAGQMVFVTDTSMAYMYTGAVWRAFTMAIVCGDGIKDASEECDDGPDNADVADKCRTSCKNPKCGDNIKDSGEECDDGGANANTADKCRTTCKDPFCGDGIKDTGEACDDGNKVDGDSCSNLCVSNNQFHMNGEFYVSNDTYDGSFNAGGGFCTAMVGQTAYIAGNNASPPNQEAGGTWQGNGSSAHASNNCNLYTTSGGSGYGVQGGYGPCNVKRHVVCTTDPKYCNGYGISFCPLWD